MKYIRNSDKLQVGFNFKNKEIFHIIDRDLVSF